MIEHIVFPNAPITEAILDIRVDLPEDVTLAKLGTFHDYVMDRFPEKQERISFTAGFKISQDVSKSLSASGRPDGYFFKSPSEQKIVQARLDGFTFNKLKPYENWDLFSSEAHDLWSTYFKVATPVKITRIALRYINRIEIPLPLKDFKEYILTVPEIAPQLPQGLSNFFMSLEIPNPDIEATAIITQTMETFTDDKRLAFIFDIDVFQSKVYSGNKTGMWDEFEKLRLYKNDIFFNSVTEKTKELFK